MLLIDHILSETICLSCFCALFSNIYHKIRITAKIGLTYAFSIVNVIFGKFLLENVFSTDITDVGLLMIHNNIKKVSEILNKWNLLKTSIQTTYLSIFAYFAAIFFTIGKNDNIRISKTNDKGKTFYA